MSVPTAELQDVLEALQKQRTRHSIEADAERSLQHFGRTLCEHAGFARDVLAPGPNQNLPVAYRRAARVAALAIAIMQRIDHERSRVP
jgi:hypothetical protein